MARKAAEKVEVDSANFIETLVKQMSTTFGSGSFLIPNRSTVLSKVDHWVSTRNFIIDTAIAGGLAMPRPIIPFGRLTEISGRNSSGKTTLLGHIVAETQARGGIAAVIDTEQALDMAYWEQLGVNLDRLVIGQADHIEKVFEIIEELVKVIRDTNPDTMICIGWDSLGGTPTKKQFESDADDKFYAEAAKAVGQNLQRVTQMIAKQKIALVINNHVYRNIGQTYGDPWVSYGGEKFQYFASLRLKLEKSSPIKENGGLTEDDENDVIIGHKHRVKVIKNKSAPSLKTVDVACLGGLGFSPDYAVYEQAIKMERIITKGSWKTWKTPSDGEVKFQGGWSGFQEKVMSSPEYPTFVAEIVERHVRKNTSAGLAGVKVEETEE